MVMGDKEWGAQGRRPPIQPGAAEGLELKGRGVVAMEIGGGGDTGHGCI